MTDPKFRLFRRGDGSKVACQIDKVIFVTRGDHGATLHFGGNAQVNVQEDFDQVIGRLSGEIA